MSRAHLTQILRRAVDDDGFAAQLATDESLLTGYDLSQEEHAALLGHDAQALREMGIEDRLIEGLRVIPRRS